MKKIFLSTSLLLLGVFAFSQKKITLYDLVKKLIQDSTGYESVGDWAVGAPATFPIKWQSDRLEMSDDMKINFFRKGTADISVNGVIYSNENKPVKWNVMLRGPRAGFTSFNISSPFIKTMKPKQQLDSLFGKNSYRYKLLKSCDANAATGFYYYELKIPKKVNAWLRLSWQCKDGGCMLGIDCYDEGSKEFADLTCAGR